MITVAGVMSCVSESYLHLIPLCSWAIHFTLTVYFSTKEHKWAPVKIEEQKREQVLAGYSLNIVISGGS